MNVLANNKEFLKYIEIWNKIESLFNEKFDKEDCIIDLYIINTQRLKYLYTMMFLKTIKNLQKINIMTIQYY